MPHCVTDVAVTFRVSNLVGFGASIENIDVAFGLTGPPILTAKSKGAAATGALDEIAMKDNWMTSSLRN